MAWVKLLFENTIIDSIQLSRSIQSFSMVDLKLNNRANLITSLIIVTTIVCTHIIPNLAHLIDCTTTKLINKITSYFN